MFKKDGEFKYTIVDDFDRVIDEKGNQSINLRKLYFGNDPEKAKFDLRKWITDADGNEICGKGFSFLTEDGPNILAETLIEEGFGRTDDVLQSLSVRDDFESSVSKVLGKSLDEVATTSEEDQLYFDPRNMQL